MMVWLRFVCACALGQPSSGTGWYDARFFVGPTLGVLQVMPRGGAGGGGGGRRRGSSSKFIMATANMHHSSLEELYIRSCIKSI